jgi:hypothetical protein
LDTGHEPQYSGDDSEAKGDADFLRLWTSKYKNFQVKHERITKLAFAKLEKDTAESHNQLDNLALFPVRAKKGLLPFIIGLAPESV